MKHSFLLLALAAAAFTSCTSAYKTGQTPDDVYFSPQRAQSEYVAVNDKDDDAGYYNSDDYYSDRQLRMKVQNRNQWSNLDEWYYNSDRYSYSYYDGFYGNNPWTANSYWNYNYNPYYSAYFNPFYSSYNFYNPYYSPIYLVNPKNPNYAVSNRPRMFNLNTYNRQLTNSNYVTRRIDLNSAPAARNTNRYNNNYNNSRSNAGDYLRNSFNNNNNSSNNNSRPSTNTNTPSSSGRSSGSSSSSSGSSAPVRRF